MYPKGTTTNLLGVNKIQSISCSVAFNVYVDFHYLVNEFVDKIVLLARKALLKYQT